MRKGWYAFLALVFLIGCAAPLQQTLAPTETPVVVEAEIGAVTEPEQTPVPTPKPTEAPTDTPSPTDTPEPTASPLPYVAADGVDTVAWISDPQHYAAKYPEYYYDMTTFLRDHRDELHLRYVIHTGDLVNKTSDDAQWQVASLAQSYIDDIPNGVLAGNHDCQSPDEFGPYCRYFGEKRYRDKSWYGGSYQDNRCHYDLMTIGGTDCVFVYLSFGPDSGCIKWANKVFAEYPDRVGFLLLHEYLEEKPETVYVRSQEGEKLFHRIVVPNPNVFFVFCGHRYGAYRQTTALDDTDDGTPDRTVHEMMFNYQAAGKVGGNGYLRLLQFDPAARTIRFLTYSPSENDFNRFDDPANREKHYEIDESAEEFTIPYPW